MKIWGTVSACKISCQSTVLACNLSPSVTRPPTCLASSARVGSEWHVPRSTTPSALFGPSETLSKRRYNLYHMLKQELPVDAFIYCDLLVLAPVRS